MNQHMISDGTVEAIKITPPVAVSALTFMGISLADIAYILTIIYTTLLIGHFAYTKFLRGWGRRRHE